MAKKVFLSFHYDNDVMRTQLIRNLGSINDNQLIQPNEWENVKRGGQQAIRNWINDQMNYKDCVIVLIGEDTANRDWVKEEIKLAKEKGKPMFGIYIHNLKDPNTGKCKKGKNPFDAVFGINNHNYQTYDPSDMDYDGFRAYNTISKNIDSWINSAVLSKSSTRFW